jgi:hypothetical protein
MLSCDIRPPREFIECDYLPAGEQPAIRLLTAPRATFSSTRIQRPQRRRAMRLPICMPIAIRQNIATERLIRNDSRTDWISDHAEFRVMIQGCVTVQPCRDKTCHTRDSAFSRVQRVNQSSGSARPAHDNDSVPAHRIWPPRARHRYNSIQSAVRAKSSLRFTSALFCDALAD